MNNYIKDFKNLRLADISDAGGKNASLGEMIFALSPHGITVPNGFAVSVKAYTRLLEVNNIKASLANIMKHLDRKNFTNLKEIGSSARQLIKNARFPDDVRNEILAAYQNLIQVDQNITVAVRSSATAEDLPRASFAGQHNSYLSISGEDALIEAIKNCFASLFNDRAIKYREDNHFPHDIPLSIGVQQMVRSDI